MAVPYLSNASAEGVRNLFSSQAKLLHSKVDATRDAYFGFIFPINRGDFETVSRIFDIRPDTAQALYRDAREFSTFKPSSRGGQITNHIFGASILALRGKSLDTGLGSVTDDTLPRIVQEHERAVLDVADARSSWFGRILLPCPGLLKRDRGL